MLLLSSAILNKPILSLRTGGVIANTLSPIINPDNLKVEGLYVQDRSSRNKLIVLYQDIRNLNKQGLIVNDHDSLSQPDILVRLKDVIDLGFNLVGKPVETVSKDKVGKVKDYAVDSETFYVQKLYIGQSLLKSFTSGQLSIDRTQVLEVTDKKIIIADLLKGEKLRASATAANTVSST